MDYKDYYKTLGVSKTATKEDISKAFKKLARKYHPDLNPGDAAAEAKFKEINEANEVLKDPKKRKLYDQLGPNWEQYQQSGGAGGFQPPPGFENVRFDFGGGGGQAGGFSDFFETIFGGGYGGPGGPGGGPGFGGFGGEQRYARRPRRGSDSEAVYELSLEEAYRGGTKAVTLSEQSTGPGGVPRTESKVLDVKVPPGIKDGQRIRLAGQGNAGMHGGGKGDLYLRIKIRPHHIYKVQDNNIILDLPVTPWEAAMGATVQASTLEGPVNLNLPAGMVSGKKLRIRGRGLGSGDKKGDQFVRVVIVAPEAKTDEERELWQKLADVTGFKAREY